MFFYTCIEFIFNVQPSIKKVFQTVSYEGFNGWEVLSFNSDETGADVIQNIPTYIKHNSQNDRYDNYDDKYNNQNDSYSN